nr:hypothetical protein Iba_chr03aCG2610 [Ipomoea batatas]
MVSGDILHHLIKKSLGLRLLLNFSQIFRIFCRFKEKIKQNEIFERCWIGYECGFWVSFNGASRRALLSAMVDQKRRTTNARIEDGAANTSKFGFFPAAAA